MKNKNNILIIVAVLIVAGILEVGFFLGGDEDAWICDSGQWVKHGNPDTPMPTSSCGETSLANSELANLSSAYCKENDKECLKGSEDNSNIKEIQGMNVETLKQGAGEEVKTGDTVSVHYVGTLEDGMKFDSSVDRGIPFEFTIGDSRLIKGWNLGVGGMKVGEKRKLTIPADLAYGVNGAGSIIPPNATIIFEIELLGVNK